MTKFLLDKARETGPGDFVSIGETGGVFQLSGETSTGTGAISVDIEVSADKINVIVAGTISLSLSTTVATDGFYMGAKWPYARANVKTISGTEASGTVVVG